MGVFLLHRVWTVVHSCWKGRTSFSSFDEYNDACLRLLARFTVTGNSWQQECSRSLLICLHRAQLHYWLAGFFIQQLPVNKSHSKAPSHPPPLISRDRLLTSVCARTIALSPLERVTAAFQKVIFWGNELQFEVIVWLNVALFCGSDRGKDLLWPQCLSTLVLITGGSFFNVTNRDLNISTVLEGCPHVFVRRSLKQLEKLQSHFK